MYEMYQYTVTYTEEPHLFCHEQSRLSLWTMPVRSRLPGHCSSSHPYFPTGAVLVLVPRSRPSGGACPPRTRAARRARRPRPPDRHRAGDAVSRRALLRCLVSSRAESWRVECRQEARQRGGEQPRAEGARIRAADLQVVEAVTGGGVGASTSAGAGGVGGTRRAADEASRGWQGPPARAAEPWFASGGNVEPQSASQPDDTFKAAARRSCCPGIAAPVLQL